MKKPTRANINTFFKSDRAILMVCISIALIFWLLVKLSQSYDTATEFSIEYALPTGKTFVSPPPSSVIATLEGSGWDLISNSFSKNNTAIVLEMAEIPSQAINASTIIDKVQKIIASSIKVTKVNFDFIFIQIESQTEKKLPVKLESNLTFSPQFQLQDSLQLIPDSIIITGPLTEVDSLTYWKTTPFDLQQINQSQLIAIPLEKPQNRQLHLSQSEVQLKIEVEQFTEKSLFIPLEILNAPDSLKIFPEKIKVTCVTGLSHFNEVNRNSFRLVVDLKGIPLNTEKNTIPVIVKKQPSFVRAVQHQPQSVEFFFVEVEEEVITDGEELPNEN